jgi:EAL domain-containing protein (putative c-di-GMP-specific phosphodiesterase class I)/CheY-like chemotaxis protein
MMNISDLLAEVRLWFGTTAKPKPAIKAAPEPSIKRPTPGVCFIVDDETAIRQLIGAVVKPMGVQVEEFGSAEALMKGLARRHPQLIFLDISLERSDAIEVLRGLASQNYSGAVNLMSGRHGEILDNIGKIGERQGIRMLPPLNKPFKVTDVREIAVANFGKAAKVPSRRIPINEALQKDWMKVWYQPKIDLKKKMLAGCEALARIEHPNHGVLLPGAFLPGADSESLTRLTEHVVLTVLRDCAQFKALGVAIRPAVNVPVNVLLNFPLAALVRENRPKGEAWKGLIVEVTEDQIVNDIALAQEIAMQLKIYDIALSIDDFGAGYSSLSRLRHFPFCELKLDMSFVQGCANNQQNAGICKAVIDLAHSFGSLAVAEGIENADDLRALFQMDCDQGQGFLLAAPMPIERFTAMFPQKDISKRVETQKVEKIA